MLFLTIFMDDTVLPSHTPVNLFSIKLFTDYSQNAPKWKKGLLFRCDTV
jgi:hypothetical protein